MSPETELLAQASAIRRAPQSPRTAKMDVPLACEITVDSQKALSDLVQLRNLMRTFVDERDWDQFHSPKNLATAISVEAAELLEPFQWLKTGGKEEMTPKRSAAVKEEMADVLLYLVRLADKMDVDLYQAACEKMDLNRLKYPADLVRGDSRKYDEYKG